MRFPAAIPSLCSLCFAFSPALPAAAAVQHFEIQAQPLVRALGAFSERTGLHVVYVTEVAEGLMSTAVTGDLDPQEALRRLLGNTGLEFKYIDEQTIGIRRKPASEGDDYSSRAPAGANAFRVARLDVPAEPASPPEEAAGAAVAAPVADDLALIDEVLVTVRRWREDPQRVPESMTVMTSETIEAAGVQSFSDFASLTPNLSVHEYFRPGVMFVTMRGISTPQGGEPPVAVIVDGVQAASLDFLNQQLFDLESIQILRGPQGALYGRGAIAGAILINTRQPTNEFEGQARVSYGNGDDLRSVVSLSGPIVADRAYFRLSGATTNREGLIFDRGLDDEADYIDEYSVRGELKLLLSDALSLDLRGKYIDGQTGMTLVETVNDSNFLDWSILPNRNMPKDNWRTIEEFSLKLDYEMAFGTFTAVSAYSDSQTYGFGDSDFGPLDIAQGTNVVNVKAFNQDIRLASRDDGRLRWVVGAFLQDRETVNDLLVEATPTTTILPPGQVLAQSEQFDTSDAWAVYGQAAYKFGDSLELTAALRYDEDKRESQDDLVPGSLISATYTELQPKLSLAYYPVDHVMLYASYGRGFRSGGFNGLRDSQQNPAVTRQYPKETSGNTEIGVKSEFADGRLTLNASMFHIDFDDQQFYFVDIANTARSIVTFDRTEIDGFELEAIAQPLRGLELSASVGISDAQIVDFNGTGQFDQNTSPVVYAHTVNLAAQYARPLSGSGLEWLGRIDYEHRGRIYWAPDNRHPFPPTDFINLRLGLQNDSWSIAGFVRNLTDEKTATLFTPYSQGGGTGHGRFRNQPRYYGVELGVRF